MISVRPLKMRISRRTTEEMQVSEIRKVSESDVGIVVHCLVTRLRESASGKI